MSGRAEFGSKMWGQNIEFGGEGSTRGADGLDHTFGRPVGGPNVRQAEMHAETMYGLVGRACKQSVTLLTCMGVMPVTTEGALLWSLPCGQPPPPPPPRAAYAKFPN